MVNTKTSDIILEQRANGVLAFNVHNGYYLGFYPFKTWAWHDTPANSTPFKCTAPNQRFYVQYAELMCAINTQGLIERHCQLTGVQDNETRVLLELAIAPSNVAESTNEVRRVYPGLLLDAGTPITYFTNFGAMDVAGFTVVYAEIDDIRG